VAAKRPEDSSAEIGQLCLGCLLEGNVVGAETMRVGTALCEHHVATSSAVPANRDVRCRRCEEEGKDHRAWTIRLGQPTCIFHTVDDAFLGDDMREHDLFDVIYEKLRTMGYPNVY
jgi:hypothetical protein